MSDEKKIDKVKEKELAQRVTDWDASFLKITLPEQKPVAEKDDGR